MTKTGRRRPCVLGPPGSPPRHETLLRLPGSSLSDAVCVPSDPAPPTHPPSILPVFLLPPDVLPSWAGDATVSGFLAALACPSLPRPALRLLRRSSRLLPALSREIAAIHHGDRAHQAPRQSRKFQERCCFCFREREDGCFQGLRGCVLTPALCTNTPAPSHP